MSSDDFEPLDNQAHDGDIWSAISPVVIIAELAFVLVCIILSAGFLALGFVPAISQDCMGSSFEVAGLVQDTDNRPISGATISITNQDAHYSEHFSETLVSDGEGHFTSQLHFMYACDNIYVEVVADGFIDKGLTFYAPGEGLSDELPDVLIITLDPE